MKLLTVHYDSYLTEQKLVKLMQNIYGVNNIVSQYKDKQDTYKRYTYDIFIKSECILVEFDGDQHYSNIDTIKRDMIKNTIIDNSHLYSRIIRIPYFVQLTTEVFSHLFQKDNVIIDQDYPHGFIDKKAKLPSNYCSHGELKFLEDLERFSYIKEDILDSLKRGAVDRDYIVGIGMLKNLI